MTDLPTVMSTTGLQPIAPVDLRIQLLNLVAAVNPGYTADLPGLLIEDIASTDVAALIGCDQFRVDLINALTPHGANGFLLKQLGAIYGVPFGSESNTTVQVQFTGSVGFVITPGFVVTDGSFQYVVRDGGVVSEGGTGNLSAIATQPGSWAIPAHTVNELVTSVPAGIILTVDNLIPGTPGAGAQNLSQYRTQVLRAGLAASQGVPRYLKTLLRNIVGVDERLISVRQQSTASGCGAWSIIVGGNGDSYQIAYAIFNAIPDVSSLLPSQINVIGITRANPGVVTTDINHLLITGQVATINDIVGMTQLNNTPLTITVLGPRSFSVGVDTSGFSDWIDGGVVTPNARNVSRSIDDYPDRYLIPYIVPPAQTVRITVTWNTSSDNFIGAAAISAVSSIPLISYVNSVPAGQPLILYELENAFRDAVATILNPQLLTRIIFSVLIDGIETDPVSGTGIIAGDPESYLVAFSDAITVIQG